MHSPIHQNNNEPKVVAKIYEQQKLAFPFFRKILFSII